MSEYLTVFDKSSGEYTEKRSKFISGVYHCESEDDAVRILSEVKSNNFGANHNVYAYVLRNGTKRFSDDSEPHGTAGKPVLDVVEGSGILDILVVVTRYFGGVLLGTGGLVRSYSTAAKNAINNADVVKMCHGTLYDIICEYSFYKSTASLIESNGGRIESTDFSDKVNIRFIIPEKYDNAFKTSLCETFSSKITAKPIKSEDFPFSL